jgi:hypothetical protein
MFWVAPVRPHAVAAIWMTVIAVGLVFLFAAYSFEPSLLGQGLRHARWLDFEPSAFALLVSYRSALAAIFSGSPALTLALPASLIVYAGWKRTRYFGNTAPLLVALLLLILAMAAPDFPGHGFQLAAIVFLFVLVAGIFADLLETAQGPLVAAALCGLLGASAIWNLMKLWRV